MACRLVGAKPLPEPMLQFVNKTIRNKLQWNFSRNSNIFIHENAFESVVCEKAAILSGPQCVVKKTTSHLTDIVRYTLNFE